MQATVQMRVLAATINYLSYGSRFPIDLPDTKKWPDYDEPLLGTLMIRVFRIHYSPQLWEWMLKRLRVYRAMVAGNTHGRLPRMNHFVNHVWFESPKCRDYSSACEECKHFNYRNHPGARADPGYLPPCPVWTRVIPSSSTTTTTEEDIGLRVQG